MMSHERQRLREGGDRSLAAQEAAILGLHDVDRDADVGLRIQIDHLLEHALAAGVDVELVVDQDDLFIIPRPPAQ